MELLKTSTRLWAPKNIFQKKRERERERTSHLISLSDRNWAPIFSPVFLRKRFINAESSVVCLQSCEMPSVSFTAAWFPLRTVTINDGEQKQDEEKRERERERGRAVMFPHRYGFQILAYGLEFIRYHSKWQTKIIQGSLILLFWMDPFYLMVSTSYGGVKKPYYFTTNYMEIAITAFWTKKTQSPSNKTQTVLHSPISDYQHKY